MSDKKVISLNPAFLVSPGKSSGSKEKTKPPAPIKTAVRQQFIAKVKDFQQRKERDNRQVEQSAQAQADNIVQVQSLKQRLAQVKEKDPVVKPTHTPTSVLDQFNKDFQSDFNKSLMFLQQLAEKTAVKEKEKRMRATLKHKIIPQVALELPPELKPVTNVPSFTLDTSNVFGAPVKIERPKSASAMAPIITVSAPAPAPVSLASPLSTNAINNSAAVNSLFNPRPPPAYGILKNGSKPTYRQTVRRPIEPPSSDVLAGLEELRNQYQGNVFKKLEEQRKSDLLAEAPLKVQQQEAAKRQVAAAAATTEQPKRKIKKRITRTMRYTLGKKKDGRVGLLISCNQTRRLLQEERQLLYSATPLEMRNYLRSKNLLKAGATLPYDVLRELYVKTKMMGDVTNTNGQTLVHNYINNVK